VHILGSYVLAETLSIPVYQHLASPLAKQKLSPPLEKRSGIASLKVRRRLCREGIVGLHIAGVNKAAQHIQLEVDLRVSRKTQQKPSSKILRYV